MTFAEFEERAAAVGDPPFSVTLNHYGGEAASRLVFLLFCNAVGVVVVPAQVDDEPRTLLRDRSSRCNGKVDRCDARTKGMVV